MVIKDKNETMQPPQGYKPSAVVAEGAYLRVEYRKDTPDNGQCYAAVKTETVTIYLNDMGREVMRTEHEYTSFTVPPVKLPERTRWEKFQYGVRLALEGLREMSKCLN